MRSLTSRQLLSGLGLSALLLVGASLSIQGCNSPTAVDPTAGDTSSLLLVSPRGGETFKVGSTMTVTWKEQGANVSAINAVDIRLSPDDGKSWIYLNNGSIAKGAAGWEAYSWTVTDSITNPATNSKVNLSGDATCKIRIQEYTAPNVYFEISKDFTITP